MRPILGKKAQDLKGQRGMLFVPTYIYEKLGFRCSSLSTGSLFSACVGATCCGGSLEGVTRVGAFPAVDPW